MQNTIATWSGGKDSCLATFKAINNGYNISYLFNTVSDDYKRVRFHGIPAELIQLQAKSLGIPLIQKETSANNYEKDFSEALESVKNSNISNIIFGDIHLEHCYTWAAAIANSFNLRLVEPLWHMSQLVILSDFINSGFKAIIVSTQGNLLGKEWLGRHIDSTFLRDIQQLPDIDPCGENGEYHTFVLDGPLFTYGIRIDDYEVLNRSGYWFLNARKYTIR